MNTISSLLCAVCLFVRASRKAGNSVKQILSILRLKACTRLPLNPIQKKNYFLWFYILLPLRWYILFYGYNIRQAHANDSSQNTLSIWMNWRVNALFAWFIVHLDFLSRKEFLRTRYVRVSFFGQLPLPKCVDRSKANDRSRRVLEYSLTGRHSTLSENEAFPWYALRLYLKISLHLLSGLLVRRVSF